MRFVIISPAKNEEQYIEKTIESMLKQQLLPDLWLIVNDNSSDRTREIVERYVAKHPWIKLYNDDTPDEEKTQIEIKEVSAFNKGLDILAEMDYDVIVKLDTDLTLPENYFSEVATAFEADERVGLCGGYCVIEKNGQWVKEKAASYHLRGAFKAYRKSCFETIGGIKPVLGWDGLDEMKAMYAGYKVEILPLPVIHHRPTMHRYRTLAFYFKIGKSFYKRGSGFLLVLIRAAVRIKQRPYFLAALSFLSGYLYSVIRKEQKYVDQNLARFINRFHMMRIIGCK